MWIVITIPGLLFTLHQSGILSDIEYWARYWTTHLDERHKNGFGLSLVTSVVWFNIFVPFRMLTRLRLVRRARPLWWANVPGAVALLGVSFHNLMWLLSASDRFGETKPEIVFESLGVLVFLTIPAGLGLGVVLLIECLRSDRISNPPISVSVEDFE